MMITEAVLIVAAYFVGAIPFGAMVARRRGVDILAKGSGNIGATNVHRVLGKAAGLTVSVLDTLKGVVPAVVAGYLMRGSVYDREWAFWTGMAAVVGHCFSPWLRFRGGKGVATGFGVLLGTTPVIALSVLAVFIVCTAATRYISLASVVASAAIVVLAIALRYPAPLVWSYAALPAFVIHRHRGNLKRLVAGQERRFSLRGGTEDVAPNGAASEAAGEVDAPATNSASARDK